MKSNGAVQFNSEITTTKLLVDSTDFKRCSSTIQGGSLYFKTGECIQEKVCYYNSTSQSEGHAYYSIIAVNQRCFMKSCSTSLCGKYENNRCVYTNNGIVQLDNFNMSNNIGNGNPTYGIGNEELGSFIKYLNLVNNIAKVKTNFDYCDGADFRIICCNFYKNHGLTNPIGQLLYCMASTNVENSCFKENTCITVFCVASEKTMIVKNCFYDQSATSLGTVRFESSKVDSNTIIFKIERCFAYFNNNNCTCYDNQKFQNLVNLLPKSLYISCLIQIFE